jgi:hypothetical protein
MQRGKGKLEWSYRPTEQDVESVKQVMCQIGTNIRQYMYVALFDVIHWGLKR